MKIYQNQSFPKEEEQTAQLNITLLIPSRSCLFKN